MDVEERIKLLLKFLSEEERSGDTFAERAEWYYQKRPLLLALLQDLYNDYTTLLDRCSRMESNHCKHPSRKMALEVEQDGHFDREESDGGGWTQVDSDAESTLSYQHVPAPVVPIQQGDADAVVVELVMRNVEKEVLQEQVSEMEQQGHESWRKIELLKKLLEVLESERVVLLNENAKLGYETQAFLKENQRLSGESMFLRRKAGELARCVLKMREDHRVYMLTRKIEDLQGQIYGLEERNKEYYQQLMMKKEQQQQQPEKTKSSNGGGGRYIHVGLVGCFQMEKMRPKEGDKDMSNNSSTNCEVKVQSPPGGGKKKQKWWGKVKMLDFFMPGCGINQYCSSS